MPVVANYRKRSDTCRRDLVRDMQSFWTRTMHLCCNSTDGEGGNIDEEDGLYINGEDGDGEDIAAELVSQRNDLAQQIFDKRHIIIDRCRLT